VRIRRSNLTQESHDLPAGLRMQHQKVDDVGPAVPGLVAVAHQAVVVRDYDAGLPTNHTRPKRRPGARGFVVGLRRAAGIRYVARVVEHDRVRDVPGGSHATRAQAEVALELALAMRRPCGADVAGDGPYCYWHDKLATPPAVNGHAPADGWRTIDLDGAALEEFDPNDHRPRPPTPRCEVCGRPTRIGERGPIRYCSTRCKSTASARRRNGSRARLTPTVLAFARLRGRSLSPSMPGSPGFRR
jgi:hypothetical protein